ncbi:MAG TPA: S1 RNA-binding domain-containing protein [Symbiobacteriaceae bacterium]|nr:S1 RNA-binding domain-containing protein [Symbiobacteriaceae bacterium]
MAVLPEGYRGQKPREEQLNLAELLVAMEERRILSVVVTQVVGSEIFVLLGSNGLGGHIFGVMGPVEFDEKVYAGYEGFVGETVDVLVTGYEADRRRISVSRRQARLMKRQELLRHLAAGDTVTGVVRSLQPYAAFVDIGGLHAILPVSEISHDFVRHPRDVMSRGDVLAVKVVEFDRESLRVRVSLKALVDPWKKLDGLYRQGSFLLGTVQSQLGEMVWVRPEPYYGLEILCPAFPGRIYRQGAQVRVKLVMVDATTHKLRGRIIGTIE